MKEKLKEKLVRFKQNFLTLPFGTRRLLNLGFVLAFTLALPLFVWAILTGNYDIRERAASGEPTPTPLREVKWTTQWASFIATNYEIQVPDGTMTGRIFRVNPSKPCNQMTREMICVSSNPPNFWSSQGLHYMTLEVTWYEYDIEMRMFIYLYSDGSNWWSNEIRVYNGQPYPNTEWVYFYGKFFVTPVGQAFTQSQRLTFTGKDHITGGPVELRFANVKFQAFLNYFKPTPTPTPNLNPPICTESNIPPATGVAPLTVTLHGSGSAGKGTGFDGYQWDFENNGSWDTPILLDAVTHTYTIPGVYNPVYRIHGINGVWSRTCKYPYRVTVLFPGCNRTCNYSINPPLKCLSNLTCYSSAPGGFTGQGGYCRNPKCVKSLNCLCTPTPIPTAVSKPL